MACRGGENSGGLTLAEANFRLEIFEVWTKLAKRQILIYAIYEINVCPCVRVSICLSSFIYAGMCFECVNDWWDYSHSAPTSDWPTCGADWRHVGRRDINSNDRDLSAGVCGGLHVLAAHQLLVRSGKPRKIMTAKKRTQILTPSNNTIIIHDHEIFLKWN